VQFSNNLQAIFGTRSENLKSDIEAYLRTAGADLSAGAAPVVSAAVALPPASVVDPDAVRTAASISAALGGARNILSAEACALTRVRVKLVDTALASEAALRSAGVAGVMRVEGGVLHLIVGPTADAMAAAIATHVAPLRR
jgi:glucose PTS system EIICB or EIICBA component